MIIEDFIPQDIWALCYVQKSFAGSNCIVRSFKLKTALGNLTRAVVKLELVTLKKVFRLPT